VAVRYDLCQPEESLNNDRNSRRRGSGGVGLGSSNNSSGGLGSSNSSSSGGDSERVLTRNRSEKKMCPAQKHIYIC